MKCKAEAEEAQNDLNTSELKCKAVDEALKQAKELITMQVKACSWALRLIAAFTEQWDCGAKQWLVHL